MEPFRGSSISRASLVPVIILLIFATLSALAPRPAAATGVFDVRRKFPRHDGRGSGWEEHLAALREHDGRRHHGRLLASVDLPLGGNGRPTVAGLYFTELGIGTPARSYYVDVDTGSDILWVNGVSCDVCPRKSGLGVPLTLYDPAGSSTGSAVKCGQEFCKVAISAGVSPSCPTAASQCQYGVGYGDGSTTNGVFFTDLVQYNQVSGDGQTAPANTSITFGVGSTISGDFTSSREALDGILGFGQSSSSMVSQLASAGKVRKIFAHCLDTVIGGGIFAIGNIVQPQVKTTPLVPNMPHYNVNLETIDVGGVKLQLPANGVDIGESDGTIIDSGTTLAYLTDTVYNDMMSEVFAQHVGMPFTNVQNFMCFTYPGSVDDGFPVVTFNFEGDLPLSVYPHDYLFKNGKDLYCMGFQSGGIKTGDGKEMMLLGDIAFSNKLVLYDLENQVIGWVDYNCSSSIKIKDDKSGSVYTVDAHDIISSGWKFQWCLFSLLVTTVCSYLML